MLCVRVCANGHICLSFFTSEKKLLKADDVIIMCDATPNKHVSLGLENIICWPGCLCDNTTFTVLTMYTNDVRHFTLNCAALMFITGLLLISSALREHTPGQQSFSTCCCWRKLLGEHNESCETGYSTFKDHQTRAMSYKAAQVDDESLWVSFQRGLSKCIIWYFVELSKVENEDISEQGLTASYNSCSVLFHECLSEWSQVSDK